MEWSNFEKDKEEFEKKMLTSERELQDLKEKIIRLEEDENVSSRRRKRAEERCEEVYKKLSEMTSEKNKTIGLLENQIVDKDKKLKGIQHELLEADKKVEELGRRNIEDLETIKRLRNEIPVSMKENMSFDQTFMQIRSMKSEEADHDQEMEHPRKKIQDSSDIIGKLRHEIIASQMDKESSDRTIKELRCKLLEAERKVEELTRQNSESVQNMGVMKHLLLDAETEKKELARNLELEMKDKQLEVNQLRRNQLEALKTIEDLKQQTLKAEENNTADKIDPRNLTNPKEEVGDVNNHACNVSSKRGREKMTRQTSSKKLKQTLSKKLKKSNVINTESSYTDCGNESPKLMSDGIIEPLPSYSGFSSIFSSSDDDDSGDSNFLMSGRKNLTLQTSSKKLRKANVTKAESSNADCRNESPNLMSIGSHFKHKDDTFETPAEKMEINGYIKAKSGVYYKLQYRSSLYSILNFLEVRKTKKVEFTEAHYECMMETAFGEFLVPFMKDEINVDYIVKNDVQLNKLLTTYKKELDCFVIGEQMMKITPLECQLIFGLKCGDKILNIKRKKTRQETGLIRRRFSNVKGRISVTLLKSKLVELLKKKNPNQTVIEDVTRIIILQSMVMFFFTSSFHYIPWSFFNYVDDLKKTVEYNWAAEITSFFMHCVKTKATDPGKVKGCVSLLMYWFCERSKELVKRITNEPDIPRFRKWSLPELTNTLSGLSSMENLESSQVSRYELVPTTLEREQLGRLASEPKVYELVPTTLDKEQLGHLVSDVQTGSVGV